MWNGCGHWNLSWSREFAGLQSSCRSTHPYTCQLFVFQCVSIAEWVLFSHMCLIANHKHFCSCTNFQVSQETASRVTLLRNCKSVKTSEQNHRSVPTCVTSVVLLISNLSQYKHLLKAYVYYVTNMKAGFKFHFLDFYQWFLRTQRQDGRASTNCFSYYRIEGENVLGDKGLDRVCIWHRSLQTLLPLWIDTSVKPSGC